MTSVAEVRRLIAADPLLRHLSDTLRTSPNHDLAHDELHCLRVAAWTVRLLPEDTEPRAGIAAALLHDLVDVPKDSPDRSRASEWSAEAAQPLLCDAGFELPVANAIGEAIRDHSFSAGRIPTSDLGRALQDADRLEALGALGIFRTISTGIRMGARYFDPDDPWAARRDLDDRAHTVDHFFTKLLHLPASMHTDLGRKEAQRRAAMMRSFLEELGMELGLPLPTSSPSDTSSA